MLNNYCNLLVILFPFVISIAVTQAQDGSGLECYYCSRTTAECLQTSGGPCLNPTVYKTKRECANDCELVYQCNPNYVRGKVCEPCTPNECTLANYADKETCENRTSCGVYSGFQCVKNGGDYGCILCDGPGCLPGMSIFDSLDECEKYSLCRSLSSELIEKNVTQWQCSIQGLCSKCGGPNGDPECLTDRLTFQFPNDCISNTGCHRPAPLTRFQCIVDSTCNLCREDLGECNPSLTTYARAEDCMQVTQCKIRESAHYAWQCDQNSRDNACAPCRVDECDTNQKVYYSIEECVLHSPCKPARQLPPSTVYQCRNNDICSRCRLDRNECNPDLRTYPTENSCLERTQCRFVQSDDIVENFDECLGFRDIFPPVCLRMAQEGSDYCQRRTLRKTCAQTCCRDAQINRK